MLTGYDIGEIVAGQRTTFKAIIKNESNFGCEPMDPYTKDSDVTILSYPKYLGPKETGIMEIEVNPAIDRTNPLDTRFGFRNLRMVQPR